MDSNCFKDEGRHPARRLEKIIASLAPEVVHHFTGCGSPIPECIEGKRVLDLGCGTGRDVYICAALAGPQGFVLGLDTEVDSLAIARRNVEPTMELFGHVEPNVAFRKGSIERLRDAEVADEDYDVVISNSAFSLVSDKPKALKEIFRVLKPGGEFYFSDIFSDRRLGAHHFEAEARESHALYEGDVLRLARKSGFPDPRVLARQRLESAAPEHASFYAETLRLFKLPELEYPEEDYGQAALYLGTIEGCRHRFALDGENLFETGRALPIGANTAAIIANSRFSPHFKLLGDRKHHFGPFKPLDRANAPRKVE